VIHERGSPETLRDPRGFAVKFYTREGNWDLVGNNLPVSSTPRGFHRQQGVSAMAGALGGQVVLM